MGACSRLKLSAACPPTRRFGMPYSRAGHAALWAALLLLLAPRPSAAGGAGRGRPEAACAHVDNCDWVATWGCSNDDGTDGFRCCSACTTCTA